MFRAGSADILLVACADGAGSARFSQLGSELACETALDALQATLAGRGPRDVARRLPDTALRTLHDAVRARLACEAEVLGVPVRELATTLLLAAVGATSAVFTQVGDGAIVVGKGREYRLLFWPDRGEYANATRFVTDSDLALHCARLRRVDEFVVLTDGLQSLALDERSRAPHAPFFAGVLGELRRGVPAQLAAPFRAFLGSAAVRERTDDDVTLVLASRVGN